MKLHDQYAEKYNVAVLRKTDLPDWRILRPWKTVRSHISEEAARKLYDGLKARGRRVIMGVAITIQIKSPALNRAGLDSNRS